ASLLQPEDLSEVEVHRLLELLVRARARLPVRTPAPEPRGVPEAGALHVVVADLNHALRPQRHEREVLAGVPPAGFRLARMADPGRGVRPAPRGLAQCE